MTATTQVAIVNRALQHVGALLISTMQDTSRNAKQAVACYDIVRRAELRRAAWRFATRRVVLRSLSSSSRAVTFSAWAVGTTYAQAAIVTGSDGALYSSTAADNVGHDPTLPAASGAPAWVAYYGSVTAESYSSTVSYFAGEIVYVSSIAYVSLTNANLNNTPSSGSPWLALGATVAAVVYLSPVGYTNASATKNVYRLPSGFMRLAPQDAKSPGVNVQATSAGQRFNDWEFEGNYLMTSTAAPIFLRYTADISNPADFDPLFVEGFAARMALELVEVLTQQPAKTQLIGSVYTHYMAQARKANAIEVGSVEGDDDDYMPLFTLAAGAQDQPQPRGNGGGQ